MVLKSYSEIVNWIFLTQNTWFYIKIQLLLGLNVGSSSDSMRVLIFNSSLGELDYSKTLPASSGYMTSFNRSSEISLWSFNE